jgi:hypothetical protein
MRQVRRLIRPLLLHRYEQYFWLWTECLLALKSLRQFVHCRTLAGASVVCSIVICSLACSDAAVQRWRNIPAANFRCVFSIPPAIVGRSFRKFAHVGVSFEAHGEGIQRELCRIIRPLGTEFVSELQRTRALERSGQPANNSSKLRLPNYASPPLLALGLGKLWQ